MWVSKKKWDRLEKRIADLEREVQGQQRQSEARLAPPMDDVVGLLRNTSFDRNYISGNAGGGGGGRIKDDSLTIETLRNINRTLSVLCSVIKDGYISVKVELK